MRKRILLVLSVLVILFTAGFLVWASDSAGPMPEALQALSSTSAVQVITRPWLVFIPTSREPDGGFIFYPGGKVDPRSYAPAAQEIAANGYLVVIVPMPLNLAVLAPGKATEVITAYPTIQTWVIGGHSLGGAMSANFAARHPEQISGLVLWAAYPANRDDLTQSGLNVLSVYGTNDQVAASGKIEASRLLLPANTRFIPIQGGNHAGFGWYGPQAGDGLAAISRSEQQAQAIQATLDFLEYVSAKNTD